MTDIFPPSGPWVYDTTLPKPDAKFNSIKYIINLSRTEVGTIVSKTTA